MVADLESLRRLREFEASIVADALGGRGILSASIVPQLPVGVMVGVAYTVQLATGDNLGVHVAIDEAEPDSVIVAKSSRPDEYGIWGAISSTAALEAGLAGFVTDGYVRDRAELAKIRFPVFAKGASLRKTTKERPGRQLVKIKLGEEVVCPGDIVIGDEDGVVVVPRADLKAVLVRAAELQEKEEWILQGLREGKSTLELLGLQASLSISSGTRASRQRRAPQ